MKAGNIGQSIRELRMLMHMSQRELAKGICTQPLISQIEAGEVSPSADMLYKFASRLGVDMNYFFEITACPRLDYVEEVCLMIRQEIRKRNYEKVAELIHAEKHNPLFQSGRARQFMLWHQGICEFYLNHNTEQAFELLNQAMTSIEPEGKVYSERKIEILNSMAVFYSEIGNNEKALVTFQSGLFHLRKLPAIQDQSIEIRILFNLAKTLTIAGNYEKSVRHCDEGIKLCLVRERLSLLGELFYQKGKNLLVLKDKEAAVECLYRALDLFELQQNDSFADIVKSTVSSALSA
ncbi:helix-turn-helix domain-containing protein [Bacillus marinisedimentorum]|uniref:helix-turn-helix domain-containing protein n=1 Tax=Bacillus marinisedimentorum TaxID=1821260 RepID=UPI000872FD22|nr:helix-turn-helix domain-containing protein [Bacillus marinisedimentorum]